MQKSANLPLQDGMFVNRNGNNDNDNDNNQLNKGRHMTVKTEKPVALMV